MHNLIDLINTEIKNVTEDFPSVDFIPSFVIKTKNGRDEILFDIMNYFVCFAAVNYKIILKT